LVDQLVRTRTDPAEQRERIVAAALNLFSQRGYAETSNAQIARAAGLRSTGLLYYYFPKKRDLLQAVLERHAPPLQLLEESEVLWALPPKEVVRRFAAAYAEILASDEAPSFMRVVLGEALRSPEVAEMLARVAPERVISFLRNYLEAQMGQGKLRRTNPELAARTILGPLFTLALYRAIFGLSPLQAVSPEELADQVVTNFWEGFKP
jgi:AcrR family transcriptional regulator